MKLTTLLFVIILGLLGLYTTSICYGGYRTPEEEEDYSRLWSERWECYTIDYYRDHVFFKGALKQCDIVLEKNPANNLARATGAWLFNKTNQPNLAIADLEYIKVNSPKYWVKWWVANEYCKAYYATLKDGWKNMELQARQYTQPSYLNKNYTSYHTEYPFNDARIYELKGDLKQAEETFTQIVNKSPSLGYELRGDFYIRNGRYREALEDFKSPENIVTTETLFRRGLLYAQFEDWQQSIDSFLSAAELINKKIETFTIEGDEIRLFSILNAYILSQTHKFQEETANKANSLFNNQVGIAERVPPDGRELFEVERILLLYAGKIKPDDFETYLKGAEKTAPFGDTVLRGSYYLGMFYKIKGSKHKAKMLFEKVAQSDPNFVPEYGLAKKEIR